MNCWRLLPEAAVLPPKAPFHTHTHTHTHTLHSSQPQGSLIILLKQAPIPGTSLTLTISLDPLHRSQSYGLYSDPRIRSPTSSFRFPEASAQRCPLSTALSDLPMRTASPLAPRKDSHFLLCFSASYLLAFITSHHTWWPASSPERGSLEQRSDRLSFIALSPTPATEWLLETYLLEKTNSLHLTAKTTSSSHTESPLG